ASITIAYFVADVTIQPTRMGGSHLTPGLLPCLAPAPYFCLPQFGVISPKRGNADFMASPLIVLPASNTEASEWRHSIWQQMLSATIPLKYVKTFYNQAALQNES